MGAAASERFTVTADWDAECPLSDSALVAYAEHGCLRVRVCDNGPGVEPALRERVFRPFFTTRRDGTGLGLALVQKIIVTHNGRVTGAGRDGGGAVFEVTLPIAA